MLGSIPSVAISDRLVRRVIDDADAHHPRHSDKQDSLPTEPSQFGADGHNIINHGLWDLAPVFPNGLCAGLHSPAADVLANPGAHAARLHGPYADHQGVAAAEALDLDRRFRRRRYSSAL